MYLKDVVAIASDGNCILVSLQISPALYFSNYAIITSINRRHVLGAMS